MIEKVPTKYNVESICKFSKYKCLNVYFCIYFLFMSLT